VVCYGCSVVAAEWPAMADGHSNPLTRAWIDRLDASFSAFQPVLPRSRTRTRTGPR
jgi:hypothetical protein